MRKLLEPRLPSGGGSSFPSRGDSKRLSSSLVVVLVIALIILTSANSFKRFLIDSLVVSLVAPLVASRIAFLPNRPALQLFSFYR